MKKIISYGRQWIEKDDIKAVVDVLNSDFLTQGPKVEELEKAICKYTLAKYCVAVSSGTAALHLAVLALQTKPGSEGITTANTFVASANAIVYGGLKPIFADIDEKIYCIDPKEISKKITPRTKLIVAVDFAGHPAQMKEIYKIAKNNKIAIIEDAAHSLGAKYPDGSKVGSCKYCDLTALSFHPVKTIATGEGGALTTNNKTLYDRLLLLRSHGITKDPNLFSQNPGPWYYEMQELGYNYRLSDIHAALGASQMKKLDRFIARRCKIAKIYDKALAGLENIILPTEKDGAQSAYHLYVVKIDFTKIGKTREKFMRELQKLGIGSQVHYFPVHLQPFYRKNFGYNKGDLPTTEKYYEQCLTLPLYPKLTDKEVDLVVKSVKKVLKNKDL